MLCVRKVIFLFVSTKKELTNFAHLSFYSWMNSYTAIINNFDCFMFCESNTDSCILLNCVSLPVQLMPGTEVAVAPKRRKRVSNSLGDSCMDSSNKEHTAKMLLRIQDPDRLCHTSTCVRGVELHMELTSVAFVHPETTKQFSLNMLQLVSIVPRVSNMNTNNNSRANIMKTKGSSITKEVDPGNVTEKKECRQAIVHLLTSESVARGHVMVSKSLRLYLRAGLHSCMSSFLSIHLPYPQTSKFKYLFTFMNYSCMMLKRNNCNKLIDV